MKQKITQNYGYIIILFLSLIPVIFWVLAKPINLRFINSYALLSSVGQITGLIGMTLFAINIILASRLSFLEDMFNGMLNVYFAHRLLGTISFILLLIHPLFLIFRLAMISLNAAALLLIPSGNWLINFGIFSLLSMMLFLTLIIYNKLPYQILRLTHKFLGFSFFLGALHTFLIPSDVSQFLPLKIYMAGLVSAGLTFYLYKSVLGKHFAGRTKYSIQNVFQLNDCTFEISMSPISKSINFTPGQFIFISFKDPLLGTESHPFSISSGTSEENLKLTIKSLGDFTSKLDSLKVGTVVDIEGPYGRFYDQDHRMEQIWIAGGVGITPFLSMAKSVDNAISKVDLYYVARDKKDSVCLDDLCEISSEKENLRILPFYTRVQGRINAQIISRISNGLENKMIYLCGPKGMMQSLRSQLLKLNVPKQNIRMEEFAFL
ncbi:FAD-binding oxidoreductase [Patescibacteria group bacterium]|nr:FAD-binding oxidoreductase [Patescibacteria group bacterium]